jgi:hypothetical protein
MQRRVVAHAFRTEPAATKIASKFGSSPGLYPEYFSLAAAMGAPSESRTRTLLVPHAQPAGQETDSSRLAAGRAGEQPLGGGTYLVRYTTEPPSKRCVASLHHAAECGRSLCRGTSSSRWRRAASACCEGGRQQASRRRRRRAGTPT